MATTADRLRLLMDEHGHDQAEVARAVGSTQGAISLILLGKSRRSRLIPEIADFYGVSQPWLRGEAVERSPAEAGKLSADHQHLLRSYDALPPVDRRAFSHIVSALSRSDTRASAHLPEKRALATMFRVMLEQLPPEMTWDEQAEVMAEWLPALLDQVVDIVPEGEEASFRVPALADLGRGSRS